MCTGAIFSDVFVSYLVSTYGNMGCQVFKVFGQKSISSKDIILFCELT